MDNRVKEWKRINATYSLLQCCFTSTETTQTIWDETLTHSLTRLYFQSKVNKQPENQVAKNTTVSAAVLCSAVFVGHLINKAGLIVLANVLNTSQTKIFHGLTVV